jgi:hypothetical protein
VVRFDVGVAQSFGNGDALCRIECEELLKEINGWRRRDVSASQRYRKIAR